MLACVGRFVCLFTRERERERGRERERVYERETALCFKCVTII
jgi:hypothetical protein